MYVQSDTLLLADTFENFRNKFIEIYGLDPACLLSTPGSTWQASLKKTETKLELLTINKIQNSRVLYTFVPFVNC